MSDTTISGTASVSSNGASPQPTKAQIHEAAQKFEALMLRQMLAQARKVDFGNSLFDQKATENFRDMQDSKMADTMAQRGTLGFARMIEAQLARQTGAGNGE
ncbi:flagellar protein FlgJ [Novosphingobium sp. SG751A]|uniref:rod-binding protein n=1 Tax=Novosphingobium sp. SG751A TaxID=2587000 RepID=UPI001551CC45|nr:rod-binding protein [Novosphingobium sp. SG751A]NOW47583.1 flagellar protein FlgJ [Novosphingobium sp. SG751A]